MGYGSLEQSENGQGAPLMVFGSFEQAVHWLIRNGYDFYGEESANWRRRKVKSVDLVDLNLMYQAMAREYEKNLVKPVAQENNVVNDATESSHHGVNIVPACETKAPTPPTPPASRVLNDQGAPVKQKAKKPTFMDNMMKFLRLFKK